MDTRPTQIYIYDRTPSMGLLKPTTLRDVFDPRAHGYASERTSMIRTMLSRVRNDARPFQIMNGKVVYAEHTLRAIDLERKRLMSSSIVPKIGASPKGKIVRRDTSATFSRAANPTNKSWGLALGFGRILAG